MKETIIIYLLIISFSLKNAIEFGKKIYFNMKNDNTFEFKFTEDGSLFIQIDGPLLEKSYEIADEQDYDKQEEDDEPEDPEDREDKDDKKDHKDREDYKYCSYIHLLELEIKNNDLPLDNLDVDYPGIAFVIPFKRGDSVKIQIKGRFEERCSKYIAGNIWMNPSTNEIKVDLKKEYEWNYDYKKDCFKKDHIEKIISDLTYSIDNAKYNAIIRI